MDAHLLSLEAAADLTGQPARRLREWCATGKPRCETEGRGWQIPEGELNRVFALAAERERMAQERRAVALAVPAPTGPHPAARKPLYEVSTMATVTAAGALFV